ncbi:MAG: FtsL-like putative cell division protein [Clostridium sp.]|nr:FtsL-like putative cell division protein [Prevotella sp.]MCM1429603.1 FtsL-like putative cell division protein [Clostridium sp.]MCM1476082.1 FtsL-like putative cell division protein [Muribaculaceae bacterium]
MNLLKKKPTKTAKTEAPAEEAVISKNVKRTSTYTSWITDLRYGKSISVVFFRRNAWLLVLILVVVLSLMGVRYKTKTRMLEITRLQRELGQVQSEKLREKAEYMSLIRETEMQRLVEANGLGLEFQEQPPYTVETADK